MREERRDGGRGRREGWKGGRSEVLMVVSIILCFFFWGWGGDEKGARVGDKSLRSLIMEQDFGHRPSDPRRITWLNFGCARLFLTRFFSLAALMQLVDCPPWGVSDVMINLSYLTLGRRFAVKPKTLNTIKILLYSCAYHSAIPF